MPAYRGQRLIAYQGVANGAWHSTTNPRCINAQFMPAPYHWSYAVTDSGASSNWLNRFYDAGFRRMMIWMPFGQDRLDEAGEFGNGTWNTQWAVNGQLRSGVLNHLMCDQYLRCQERHDDIYPQLTSTFEPVIGDWLASHPDVELIVYTGNVFTGYVNEGELSASAVLTPDWEEDFTLGQRSTRFYDALAPFINIGCSIAFDASVSIGASHWWYQLIRELKDSGTRVYIESYPWGPFENLADLNFVCDHTHYRNVRQDTYWPEYNNGNPLSNGFMGYLPKSSITGEKMMLLVNQPPGISAVDYWLAQIPQLLARDDVDSVCVTANSLEVAGFHVDEVPLTARGSLDAGLPDLVATTPAP